MNNSISELAEKGDAEARIILGMQYQHSRHYEQALLCYRMAAKQNSRSKMGDVNYEGRGVDSICECAHFWYVKNACRWYYISFLTLFELRAYTYDAEKELREIESTLSHSEIEKVKSDAREKFCQIYGHYPDNDR